MAKQVQKVEDIANSIHDVWIAVDLDERIVFETPYEQRWAAALAILGIDPARLSMVGPSDVS